MVKNAIKIYGRIKPVVKRKDVGQYFIQEGNKEDTLFLQVREREYHEEHHSKTELSQFKFYKVFDQHVRQHEIFSCVAKPIVDSVLQGYNGTVFAYGQTGSGKTFTITGGPDDFEDRGLIPRAIEYVFRKIASSDGSLYTVCVTYLQIYNEAAYDLLGHHQRMARLEDLPKLNLLDDTEGYLHIRNLSLHPVNSENEALNLLFLGDTNRAIAETPMNQASSRSHCMFTIHLAIRRTAWKNTRRAKLHFVDLAGSERLNKKGGRSAHGSNTIDGRTINEARHINLSLHYLEQVITALAEAKRVHVPYRNCIITTMLRDSIGGNCLTSMVATLSLDHHHLPETLATCRFAQRVALVKNEATLNEDRDPMQEVSVLKAEVKRLKDQIRLLSNDKHYVDGHLSPAEETECRELVDAFLENSQTLELPMDLRKIEYCCFLLKEAVVEARRGNNFPKHERGTSQHVEKCMQKLLQQRNNEIAILTELLRKERKHRMNSKSPKRTLSPPGPKPSFDDYQKLIRHAGVSLNKHEQAALKKYAANPSHTNEVDNLKAQLRLRHTAAKKIHDKIEENKARIVESRKMLVKLENGIPSSSNVATRQKQLHAELKGILETEQSKYCSNLTVLRDLKNECDHLTHSLRQAEVRFLHNFQCWLVSQGQASILPKHTPPQEIPQKLVENPRIHLSMPSLHSNNFPEDNITINDTSKIPANSSPSTPLQTVHNNASKGFNTYRSQPTHNFNSSPTKTYHNLSLSESSKRKTETNKDESFTSVSALRLQCLSRESLGDYFACTELSFDDIKSNKDNLERHQSSSQREGESLDSLFSSHIKDQNLTNTIRYNHDTWLSHKGSGESPLNFERKDHDSESNCLDFSDRTFSLPGETFSYDESYRLTEDFQRESQEKQKKLQHRNVNTSPIARQMKLQVNTSHRYEEFRQYKDIYSLPPPDARNILNESPITICLEEHTPPGTPPFEGKLLSKTDPNIDLNNQDHVFSISDFNVVPQIPFTDFYQHTQLGSNNIKNPLTPDFSSSAELNQKIFTENKEKLHIPDTPCTYFESNVNDTTHQTLSSPELEKVSLPLNNSGSVLNNNNKEAREHEDFGTSLHSTERQLENTNANKDPLQCEQDTKSSLSIKDIPLTGDKEVDDEIIAFYEAKQRALQNHNKL